MIAKVPNAARSHEEAMQVNNDDLFDMTPAELANETYRAARIAARNPRAIVWRGRTPISARQWASERIAAAFELLRPPATARQRPKAKAWVP